MKQTFWMLVILFCVILLWLPVLESCPYNVKECICSGESLVCEKVNGIPALLNNSDGNITDLTFTFCNIDNIGENSLPSNLHKLKFLYVTITSISPEAFSNSSTTLKYFGMIAGAYSELPEALLKITSLTELQLSDIKIANWNIAVLQHLGKSVRSLVIAYDYFLAVPEWIKYFTMVNSVDLTLSKFIEFSFDDFSNARNLTNLKVQFNLITDVTCTEDTKVFNTLETLDMTGNYLTSIPSCVSRMSRLSVLLLGNNKISSLTSVRLPLQLKELDLHVNHILRLTDNSFQHSSSLVTLMLGYSELHYISPLAFQPLENLRVLDLGYTELVRIPVGITKLPRLKILNMVNIKTLKCEYPVDEELVIWYKSLNNTKINGKCSYDQMTITYYLGNDTHSHESSGSNHIIFSALPYFSSVCLFFKVLYTFSAC